MSCKKNRKKVNLATKKQIAFKDSYSFFKKEIIDGKTMYHTRLMNIFILSRVKKDRLSIYFINSLNKEKKWVHLFALRDRDSFLGMFYGFKKIRRNEFYSDYASVCKLSKEIFRTFNKAYYIEFRFKTGSVFLYIQALAYLIQDENSQCKKLYRKILNLKKGVQFFF
ncbi:DUF226 domain-containing protein [Borreliella turdi]|uniref:DUF226 domain-containing protein n=1 Tax=Borreliella turdi TaxID=57863 RepID=UPI001F312051|nr:DUF226 domain-containing protein [Borreliella turdi]